MRTSWLVLLLLPTLAWAGTYGVRLDWVYTQGRTPAVAFQVYRQERCEGPWLSLPFRVAAIPQASTYVTADYDVALDVTYCWRVTALAEDGEESEAAVVGPYTLPSLLWPPVPATPSRE